MQGTVQGITPAHWVLFTQIRKNPIHPRAFRDKWQCSNDDIALFLGVTRSLVERWFLLPDTKSYQEPHPRYTERLAEVDYILSTAEMTEITFKFTK